MKLFFAPTLCDSVRKLKFLDIFSSIHASVFNVKQKPVFEQYLAAFSNVHEIWKMAALLNNSFKFTDNY